MLIIFAGAAWLVLAGLVAVYRASVQVPAKAVPAAAAAALALAVAAAGRTVVSVWRGPALQRFSHDEAVCCSPSQAAAVRAAAQLRGTLGGAGHVHRGHLALPALGWLAAAAFALEAVSEPVESLTPLWAGAALVLGIAARVFPARPFYYREAVGNRVVFHPRIAWEEFLRLQPHLLHDPAAAPLRADAGEQTAPASGEVWGTSLIAAPSGAKDADRQIDPVS